MKKLLCITIAIVLCFVLFACSENKTDTNQVDTLLQGTWSTMGVKEGNAGKICIFDNGTLYVTTYDTEYALVSKVGTYTISEGTIKLNYVADSQTDSEASLSNLIYELGESLTIRYSESKTLTKISNETIRYFDNIQLVPMPDIKADCEITKGKDVHGYILNFNGDVSKSEGENYVNDYVTLLESKDFQAKKSTNTNWDRTWFLKYDRIDVALFSLTNTYDGIEVAFFDSFYRYLDKQ